MGVRKIILFANIILISSSHNKKKRFYTIVIRNNISRVQICNNCTKLNWCNQSDARAANCAAILRMQNLQIQHGDDI